MSEQNSGLALKTRLRSDLTVAMKSKQTVRINTLRMVLSAIQHAEVAGRQARELDDADVIRVLTKEAKKRNEAAVVYDQAGRCELAATERAELEIIDEYLPTALTDAEVNDLAAAAVAEVAEQLGSQPTMRQMGQVMKVATRLAAGRADGSQVSAAVKAQL